ncbi:hypothetical protein D3C78_795290 [compost metagenome]
MDEILSKKHYRQTFYVVVLLLLLLAAVLRFYTIPALDPTVKSTPASFWAALLDNFITSLVITILIGSFIFWLRPEIVKRSAIEVVDPKQIGPLLKKATLTSKFWIYRGACGRYTRTDTFPKLAEAARNEGIGRDISIYLLNPKNNDLCAEYATYRRSLKSGRNGDPWTRKSVQEEVISTAVSALRFQSTEPLLRIKLFFVDGFSAFRLDISDRYVIVTKEEREASAMRADAGTYFYDSYKDDVRLMERQSTELTCCGKVEFDGEISEEKLKEALKCSGLDEVVTQEELSLSNILQKINSPVSPY